MTSAEATLLPKGTRLKPNGKTKTSNYVQLQNIEEVEVISQGNVGGGGGSYGAQLIKVKLIKVHGKVINKDVWGNINEYLYKNNAIKINGAHFELIEESYPIF